MLQVGEARAYWQHELAGDESSVLEEEICIIQAVETLNLKTEVHTDEVGARPHVILEPTDHPLAVEQRTGITVERVQKIAELVLHPMA